MLGDLLKPRHFGQTHLNNVMNFVAVLTLLRSKSRKVVKAVLGFVKVRDLACDQIRTGGVWHVVDLGTYVAGARDEQTLLESLHMLLRSKSPTLSEPYGRHQGAWDWAVQVAWVS